MKTIHNIQLAVYAAILSLTLAWLLVSIANTATLAFREGGLLSCVGRQHHHLSNPTIQRPAVFGYFFDSKNKKEEEEEEEEEQDLKLIIPSTQEIAIMPPPAVGGGGSSDENDDKTSNLIVSDLLVKTPKINVFASLTRDFHPIVTRLNDQSQNTTVLAPLNSAINALPRKPWEDPEDYERYGEAEAYGGPGGQERAKRNLQRFVEAHLVPVSPWSEGEEVETVGGGKVKWVKEGDSVFIEPGHIEVDSLAAAVSNGNVWVLKGVINYQ